MFKTIQNAKTLVLAVMSIIAGCYLQACNENNKEIDEPFTRNSDGTVTDINGNSCKSDDGSWADCYQETYSSSCKNGKAVVCGNLYTNFEVFEYDCDCRMVNGKATCGECTPGEIGERDTVNQKLKICNSAGQWEEMDLYNSHPDEMKPCDPTTYKSSCKNGFALECGELDGRVHAADCNNVVMNGRPSVCIEVDEHKEETEFNQYTLLCESVEHRAYCAGCQPGEEAETETVCVDSYALNDAPVKCSEYGYWIDKSTDDYPKIKHCDNGCAQGKCLGNFVKCIPDQVADHVCYTEDSFVTDSVTCMATGERWMEDRDKELHIEYCAKGCVDNVCMN